MTAGCCNPRMTGVDREVALSIKRGDYNYERTLDTLKLAIDGMKAAEAACKLPEAPDMAAVNDFVTQLHLDVVLRRI
jgi:hypothetical protein